MASLSAGGEEGDPVAGSLKPVNHLIEMILDMLVQYLHFSPVKLKKSIYVRTKWKIVGMTQLITSE